MAPSGSVPVSLDALRALTHRTRFRVLGALQERPKTVSELARELDASKGTIHRHLETLVEAGFVHRREDERQWVYHELTEHGEALAEADRPRVVIELASSLVLAAAGAAVVAARARLAGYYSGGSQEGDAAGGPGGDGGFQATGEAGLLADPTTWLAAGVILVLLAVLLVALARRELGSRG